MPLKSSPIICRDCILSFIIWYYSLLWKLNILVWMSMSIEIRFPVACNFCVILIYLIGVQINRFNVGFTLVSQCVGFLGILTRPRLWVVFVFDTVLVPFMWNFSKTLICQWIAFIQGLLLTADGQTYSGLRGHVLSWCVASFLFWGAIYFLHHFIAPAWFFRFSQRRLSLIFLS